MKHKVEYLLVVTVGIVVRLFPIFMLRPLGTMLGALVYTFDRRHRKIAHDNLRTAFPGRSHYERQHIARGVFSHIGRLVLELLKLRGIGSEAFLNLLDSEGEERVREAYKRGQGVLFFSGHFGYWEVSALSQGLCVAPMSLVVRPLDNPMLDQLLLRLRMQTGNSVIPRKGSVRRIMRELAANKGVGLLIDQHLHGPDAVFVTFFGRRAATTSALAAMALRTGAVVVPLFALPSPGGRYRVIAEHPIEPPVSDGAQAVQEFTQRCTDVLEMYVRKYPELWFWMHRRWRFDDMSSSTDESINLSGRGGTKNVTTDGHAAS